MVTKICHSGDSGSAVFNNKQEIVGVIKGSNATISFFVPADMLQKHIPLLGQGIKHGLNCLP